MRHKEFLAIFDLDGTLFDTGEVNYHSYAQALGECDLTLSREDYLGIYNGMHYTDFLPRLFGCEGIYKKPELSRDEVLLMEEIEKVHERKKELYTGNLFRARENIHLFEMIKGLSDTYHMALVTTANKTNAMQILETFSRRDCFEYILTGEDITKVKPDPEGFLMAMRYFGVDGGHTMIFEDSKTGLEAAKRSGAAVFAVKGF